MDSNKPFVSTLAKEMAKKAAEEERKNDKPGFDCPVCKERVTELIFNMPCRHYTCVKCADMESCIQCSDR